MKKFTQHTLLAAVLGLFLLSGCGQPGGEFPGYEFMPDMAHGTAYEANYYDYYFYNTFGSEEEYRKYAGPRLPVTGTMPRGYAGVVNAKNPEDKAKAMSLLDGTITPNALKIPVNGSVPFYYGNSDAERERAAAEIVANPYPITEKGLKTGKELYDINCGICHGKKGEGNGSIYESGAYPAAPANFLQEDIKAKTNGSYYHTIMHGKGVMGGYSDKLSYEERWQVIHYIRSMQAKADKREYKAVSAVERLQNDLAGVNLENDEFLNQIRTVVGRRAGVGQTLALKNVFFETGRSDLRVDSQRELNKLAFALAENKDLTIEVAGHTDNVGHPNDNLTLSKNRARTVRNYLVGKGISSNRLRAKGYGEAKPVAPNETDAGRAQNRRTEFTILGQ